jgi:hypothetical protein
MYLNHSCSGLPHWTDTLLSCLTPPPAGCHQPAPDRCGDHRRRVSTEEHAAEWWPAGAAGDECAALQPGGNVRPEGRCVGDCGAGGPSGC